MNEGEKSMNGPVDLLALTQKARENQEKEVARKAAEKRLQEQALESKRKERHAQLISTLVQTMLARAQETATKGFGKARFCYPITTLDDAHVVWGRDYASFFTLEIPNDAFDVLEPELSSAWRELSAALNKERALHDEQTRAWEAWQSSKDKKEGERSNECSKQAELLATIIYRLLKRINEEGQYDLLKKEIFWVVEACAVRLKEAGYDAQLQVGSKLRSKSSYDGTECYSRWCYVELVWLSE